MKKIIHNEQGEPVEVDMTADEIAEWQTLGQSEAWKALRTERDGLLAGSDWTVLSDTPAPTAAWKTYRQALRDLPANTTDPHNVVWPTPPS
jgi:hypothetical protein